MSIAAVMPSLSLVEAEFLQSGEQWLETASLALKCEEEADGTVVSLLMKMLRVTECDDEDEWFVINEVDESPLCKCGNKPSPSYGVFCSHNCRRQSLK